MDLKFSSTLLVAVALQVIPCPCHLVLPSEEAVVVVALQNLKHCLEQLVQRLASEAQVVDTAHYSGKLVEEAAQEQLERSPAAEVSGRTEAPEEFVEVVASFDRGRSFRFAASALLEFLG